MIATQTELNSNSIGGGLKESVRGHWLCVTPFLLVVMAVASTTSAIAQTTRTTVATKPPSQYLEAVTPSCDCVEDSSRRVAFRNAPPPTTLDFPEHLVLMEGNFTDRSGAFYGRNITEDWPAIGDVYLQRDSTTGLPRSINGGEIRLSEILPGGDSTADDYLRQVAMRFLRANRDLLEIDPSQLDVHSVLSEGIVNLVQYVKGVRVTSGHVQLWFRRGVLANYKSEYKPVPKLSVEPTLSKEDCFATAKKVQEQRFTEMGYPGIDLQCQKAELVIFTRRAPRGVMAKPARLSWSIDCCLVEKPLASLTLVIDAHTGKLIESRDNIIREFDREKFGSRIRITDDSE